MFSGVISDKFFGGKRNVPALLFGLLNVSALCLFLLVPGVHLWLDVLAMIMFGLGIGVLLCFLGGLMAVDIAPRNASGAALGVVGIASYIGAGLQDVMSGLLIEGNKTVVDGLKYMISPTSTGFGLARQCFPCCWPCWCGKRNEPNKKEGYVTQEEKIIYTAPLRRPGGKSTLPSERTRA